MSRRELLKKLRSCSRNIVSENRFTLYEYFITDKVGHAQDMAAARTVLQNLRRHD